MINSYSPVLGRKKREDHMESRGLELKRKGISAESPSHVWQQDPAKRIYQNHYMTGALVSM